MTPEQLRSSILQYAIEGKLVEQRKEEGTAEELYRQIQEEKQKLIKEGKIKKEKQLVEIIEDEIPFDIPDSWKWVRMIDILDVRDGTHDTPKYVIDGIPLITSKNLVKGSLDFENVKNISEEDALSINQRSRVDKNDIIFAMIGTIGNPVLVKTEREFCIKNVALFKAYNEELIHMKYILNFLLLTQETMKKAAKGGVQSFVSLKILRAYLVPLPPLEEQKRIVAKIEELQPYIDAYEEAWTKLEAFNNKFPGDMKKSILQYAIEGKLVEQRKEEGTAEELYNKIKSETEIAVSAGKIKKRKILAEITEDEIPYDIPESWKWVRLYDLSEVCDIPFADGPFGSNLKSEHYTSKKEVRIIQLSNIGEFGWKDKNIKYTTFSHLEEIKRSEVSAGDIVIAKMMPAGRAIIVPEGDIKYVLSSDAVKFVPHNLLSKDYLYYAINSQMFKNQVYSEVQGITRVRTSLKKLMNYIIPLPPLEEQKRIVSKIEELLPLCEALK